MGSGDTLDSVNEGDVGRDDDEGENGRNKENNNDEAAVGLKW